MTPLERKTWRRDRRIATGLLVVALACSAMLPGCVVYEPVPTYPGTSKFDRVWNAALGGAQDAGVTVTAADPNSGTIRGVKDGIDVSVAVMRQADGGVHVKFDTRDPGNRDPGLSNRFTQAYERRMGR